MKVCFFLVAIACAVVWSAAETFGGEIYVVNTGTNSISEYTTSGAAVNPALVTGLSSPGGVAYAAGRLFVVNAGNGTIGEYNARTGAVINPALISGLRDPFGITASAGFLYVTDSNTGTIGKYTLSGATVDARLVSGLSLPLGIAVSGDHLFVTANNRFGAPSVREYTTAGASVNPALITGFTYSDAIAASGGFLFISEAEDNSISKYTFFGAHVDSFRVALSGGGPAGIAISGGDLFVTDASSTVGEYDAITGVPLNRTLISGLVYPTGIAVTSGSVPDSASTFALLFLSVVVLFSARLLDLRRHCAA